MGGSEHASGVDAMLFDFGGVIIEIDFDRVFARWAQLAHADAARVKARFSHGDAYQRFEIGAIGAAEYFDSLRHDLDIDLDDAAFADGWQRVLGPEIPATVAALRRLEPRVPLYLFSNTNALHYETWSARHAAALAPFRRQFLSFRMGMRKPDRDAFEAVARAIAVAPERILFFDDTVANIEGARAAGLRAVHAPTAEDVAHAISPWFHRPEC